MQRPMVSPPPPPGAAPAAIVLLIEDDPDNLAIYSLALRHGGYAVLEAKTGEEAMELLRGSLPDLILLDISLPGRNGYDVARALKAAPRTRGIPLIAVTAHAFAEDQIRAREAGFDRYLAKPVEPRRVLEEVARALAARPSGPVRAGSA